jgi:hypothetical protein
VAGDLSADREKPRADEPPILIVRDSPEDDQEYLLDSVIYIGRRYTLTTQRPPDEIGVLQEHLLDQGILQRRFTFVLAALS